MEDNSNEIESYILNLLANLEQGEWRLNVSRNLITDVVINSSTEAGQTATN